MRNFWEQEVQILIVLGSVLFGILESLFEDIHTSISLIIPREGKEDKIRKWITKGVFLLKTRLIKLFVMLKMFTPPAVIPSSEVTIHKTFPVFWVGSSFHWLMALRTIVTNSYFSGFILSHGFGG